MDAFQFSKGRIVGHKENQASDLCVRTVLWLHDIESYGSVLFSAKKKRVWHDFWHFNNVTS